MIIVSSNIIHPFTSKLITFLHGIDFLWLFPLKPCKLDMFIYQMNHTFLFTSKCVFFLVLSYDLKIQIQFLSLLVKFLSAIFFHNSLYLYQSHALINGKMTNYYIKVADLRATNHANPPSIVLTDFLHKLLINALILSALNCILFTGSGKEQ